MKTFAKNLAVLSALVLLGSACGDDGGGGTTAPADDPLVQAIVDDIIAEGDGLTADRAEAECFVGGVVGEIGTARLNALGVTETNVPALDEIGWTEAEAGTVVDAMFDCVDVADGFVDQMELAELDETQRACVNEAFSEDVLKEFMVGTLTGDADDGQAFVALMGELSACGVDPFGG